MGTARADSYSAASGAGIYAGLPSPMSLPSWATAPVGQWAQIPGTSVPGVIDAFCGMAVRDDSTGVTVWHGASGGHSDNPTNNSVYAVNLATGSPQWQTLRGASDPTGTNTNLPDTAFFTDGRPLPVHTYSSPMWVPGANRYVIWRSLGAGSAGQREFRNVHAFNPAVGVVDWDPPNTWPSLGNTFYVSCQNPNTGEAYCLQSSFVQTYSPVTMVKTADFSLTAGVTAQRGAQVYDTKRSRIFHFCVGDNWTYGDTNVTAVLADPTNGAAQKITINPSAAYSDFLSNAPKIFLSALTYNADLDVFYFYHGGEAGNPAGYDTRKVYVITPNSGTAWDMSLMSTSGVTPAVSAGGVNNKVRYIPRWKLLINVVRDQNIYYLRTQ